MIGIILLLVFSLYVFCMDLVMGYTQESETFILRAQNASSVQTGAPSEQKPHGADNTAGPASPVTPQVPATPIPANGR